MRISPRAHSSSAQRRASSPAPARARTPSPSSVRIRTRTSEKKQAMDAVTEKKKTEAAKSPTSGLRSYGLPVGSGQLLPADAFKPQSIAVGASCLLFALLALYGHLKGDLITTIIGSAVSLISLSADYGGNCDPPIFSATTRNLVCKVDRATATAFVLWLMINVAYVRGVLMCLWTIPLMAALSYSRASTSRRVWIMRHCAWHAFAVAEGLLILHLTYSENQDHALKRPTALLACPPAAVGIALLLL